MHKAVGLVCVAGLVLVAGCAEHRSRIAATPPAIVVDDAVREAPVTDFLRVGFLPAGVQVTSIAAPGARRGFATATVLYSPPLKVAEYPVYSGLVNNDKNVLVAMRCKVQQPEKVDAILATWPNVFLAIQRDVPVSAGDCANPDTVDKQMACFAQSYRDAPQSAAPVSLSTTFQYAGTIYDGKHADLAKWLQTKYGIYPAFSGMGYSVKDSYSIDTQPMNSQQILMKSVSSEYLLKNVPLADAGCRCISVAPYEGRSNDRLDPEFIDQAGGVGSCKAVPRLGVAK